MKILKKVSFLIMIVIFSQLTLTAFASWSQQAKFTSSDGAANDNFGSSVDISGEYAVIGAPGDESNQGSAYIFKREGVIWTQKAKLTASDGASGDYFGQDVSISGDYVVIGAEGDGSYQGSAYVYKKPGGEWATTSTYTSKLTASDGNAGDYYGHAVDISGEYVIVGAYVDDGYQGSVFIHKKDQGGTDNWGQIKKLSPPWSAGSPKLGMSVSIYGDYAVAGVGGDDEIATDAGAAYVFYKNEGGADNWGTQGKLTASDGANSDYFGMASISIHTNYIAVSAYYDDNAKGTNAGAVYIYKKPGASWTTTSTYTQKIIASNLDDYDDFGIDLSIEDAHLMVGTNQKESAYYYIRTDETWGSEEIITPTTLTGLYGSAVAMNGTYSIIGAKFDSETNLNQGAAFTEGYAAQDVPEFKTYIYIATLFLCFMFLIKLSPKFLRSKNKAV